MSNNQIHDGVTFHSVGVLPKRSVWDKGSSSYAVAQKFCELGAERLASTVQKIFDSKVTVEDLPSNLIKGYTNSSCSVAPVEAFQGSTDLEQGKMLVKALSYVQQGVRRGSLDLAVVELTIRGKQGSKLSDDEFLHYEETSKKVLQQYLKDVFGNVVSFIHAMTFNLVEETQKYGTVDNTALSITFFAFGTIGTYLDSNEVANVKDGLVKRALALTKKRKEASTEMLLHSIGPHKALVFQLSDRTFMGITPCEIQTGNTIKENNAVANHKFLVNSPCFILGEYLVNYQMKQIEMK
ncbi:MAG TPA: hypothetical protein HPQ00_15160, partial [Magnetococcales bacterium]|nr:hypothetical protein [Magnetococcales bacterium]